MRKRIELIFSATVFFGLLAFVFVGGAYSIWHSASNPTVCAATERRYDNPIPFLGVPGKWLEHCVLWVPAK